MGSSWQEASGSQEAPPKASPASRDKTRAEGRGEEGAGRMVVRSQPL